MEKITIQNTDLLSRSLQNLKKAAIRFEEGPVLTLKDLLLNLVEVGCNYQHKIRLHLQLTEEIGFLLYLIDFNQTDEEDSGDTRENFRRRVATSLDMNKRLPDLFPEKIILVEEHETWGWYLSIIPGKVLSLKQMMEPQDLSDVHQQIQNLLN